MSNLFWLFAAACYGCALFATMQPWLYRGRIDLALFWTGVALVYWNLPWLTESLFRRTARDG